MCSVGEPLGDLGASSSSSLLDSHSPSVSRSPSISVDPCAAPAPNSFLYVVIANTNFDSRSSLIASLGLSEYVFTPLQTMNHPESEAFPASSTSTSTPPPSGFSASSTPLLSSSPLLGSSSGTPPFSDAAVVNRCETDDVSEGGGGREEEGGGGEDQSTMATTHSAAAPPFSSLRTSTGRSSLVPSSPHHIAFTTGSQAVEVFHGEIHLFRDEPVGEMPKNARALPSKRSDLVCVLALPGRMSSPEIWDWIGGYQTLVGHLRIIRDSSPNKFMVLIRFVDLKSAEMFYSENNLKYFNSMEPEVCHLLFVREAIFLKPDVHGTPVVFRPEPSERQLVELPNCPVCLERLDTSETGLLTSVCNHTFHCSCLAKWKSDAGCPVCRYCLDKCEAAQSQCSECERTSHLWICLICGHIGCGRYEDRHAFQHFQQTQHTFSLELETQRVWDYVGDGYVHRLIQNKSDGKLVEFGAPAPDEAGDLALMEKHHDRKIHDILTEYNFLLTSQLETQRAFYESQMQKLSDHHFQLREQMRAISDKLAKADEALAGSQKEAHRLQSVASSKSAKLSKVQDELEFVRELNASMKANQDQWQHQINLLKDTRAQDLVERDQQITDLQEQIRDLTFFIEAQKTISNIEGSTELRDGSVLLMPSPTKRYPAASSSKTRPRGSRDRRR
ncbi:MAG: UBP-type zinc finger domain-containing protein [archaeon]|nr:UBP-type zinc finger domain-containing protein [archaeon]